MRTITQTIFKFGLLLITLISSGPLFSQTEGKICETLSADYNCGSGSALPYNFFWENKDGQISALDFYNSQEGKSLSFEEFDNGTIRITGTTYQGTCAIDVHLVIEGKSTWAEWQAKGGKYKSMGCSGANPENLTFYEIDESQSYLVSAGTDCVAEGTYKITTRPDTEIEHLGAFVGPGGALFQGDPNAVGFATWAWLGTDNEPQQWKIDFNFLLGCEEECVVEDVTDEVTVCNGASYEWSQDGKTYTALDSPVEITLQDNNGCDYTATLIINEYPETNDEQEEVTVCKGESYVWDQNGQTYTALDSPVVLDLQDQNGCDYSITLIINESEVVLSCVATVVSNVSVNGGNDGEATVNPSGGTAPYTYEWDNGEKTKSIENLSAGTYQVTVTDAVGCTTTCSVEITEPSGGGGGCETAFALLDGNDETEGCFLDDGFNRWGWTNFLSQEGTYNFNIYAGAGQCDISKGEKSAEMIVTYQNGEVSFEIDAQPGFVIKEAQIYFGSAKYPTKNGNPTVAPGQYPWVDDQLNDVTEYDYNPTNSNLSGGIYIIVHLVTCGSPVTKSSSNAIVKPYPTLFTSELNVNVEMKDESQGVISVHDMNGNMLHQMTDLKFHAGENILQMNMPELPSGMYLIYISMSNGERIVKKVIRQ